ncbi:hypothetical protein ABEB36_009099 [Hypothenemus hampei]|uniref:Uncharacterized protein n=1 Tax=Hypothenemus hampei TaxID=57062 RepID=A0ABD1EP45_HYPHA
MDCYVNAELTDIHFMYGVDNGDSLKSMQLYGEQCSNKAMRHIPGRKILQIIHPRLHETGTFNHNGGLGRPNPIITVELEEHALTVLEEIQIILSEKVQIF